MTPSNFDLEGFLGSCFLDFKKESDMMTYFSQGLYCGGLSSLEVPHPQILSDLLTLSQPGGADSAHHITTGTSNFFYLPSSLLLRHPIARRK